MASMIWRSRRESCCGSPAVLILMLRNKQISLQGQALDILKREMAAFEGPPTAVFRWTLHFFCKYSVRLASQNRYHSSHEKIDASGHGSPPDLGHADRARQHGAGNPQFLRGGPACFGHSAGTT